MIRLLDVVLSALGVIILSPFLLVISAWVTFDSTGGAFFTQVRVGKDGQPFHLLKFRTMRPASESKGQLTIGTNDPRITNIGKFLRAYKLDELPQLINVLIGDMSLVGPRPEVPKYVALYTQEQRRILTVKPGITDQASLEYFEENDVLAKSDNPEQTYVLEIMPHKIDLNMSFIENPSMGAYFSIIGRTIVRILS